MRRRLGLGMTNAGATHACATHASTARTGATDARATYTSAARTGSPTLLLWREPFRQRLVGFATGGALMGRDIHTPRIDRRSAPHSGPSITGPRVLLRSGLAGQRDRCTTTTSILSVFATAPVLEKTTIHSRICIITFRFNLFLTFAVSSGKMPR